MNFPALFTPLQIGPYTLSHRVIMAPLTRMRADSASFAARAVTVIFQQAVHVEHGHAFARNELPAVEPRSKSHAHQFIASSFAD